MQPLPLHEEEWEYVRTLLPSDLDESARRLNALVRCRNVPDAAALIRLALAYALSDLSLKDVAAWASALDVAQITGPALFYRLRESEQWLEYVLGRVLSEQVPQAVGGWPVRIVDATVINGPGNKAIQWRAHVQIDSVTGGFRAVELTDNSGGEKLSRHQFRPGEIVLGDRAYATARGVHAVRQADAHVIVRFNPGNVRTYDMERKRIFLIEKESTVPVVGEVEFEILIPVPQNPQKVTGFGTRLRQLTGYLHVPSQHAHAPETGSTEKLFGFSPLWNPLTCQRSPLWDYTVCAGKSNFSSRD